MDPYAELGVPRDADDAAVRRAYRKHASKAHPDKGGSEEQFHVVKLAYDILRDRERRQAYDETGSTDHKSPTDQAQENVVALFMSYMDSEQLEFIDIFAEMRRSIHKGQADARRKADKLRKAIARQRKIIKRIVRKKGKDTLFSIAVENNIRHYEEQIADINKFVHIGDLMFRMLGDYSLSMSATQEAEAVRMGKWPMFTRD